MHKLAALVVLVIAVGPAREALAAPVMVDRDATFQQLQSLSQELAIVQQQLDASPGARAQFAWSLQQLTAAQLQLGELMRMVQTAPHARPGGGPPPGGPPGPAVLTPIGEATLRALVQQVSAIGFSDDKLNILRQAVNGNFFLVDQAARILPLFAHSSDRLAALRMLAPQLLDRGNTFKLIPLFSFSGDREAAQRILESAPPLQAR
jgi:Domain of unknown function (DUF4476)